MFQYKFPDIGEGITEGTLTKWLVKEGDKVKEGQDIAEIETDKMTTTLPSAASGIVHKLHVEEYGNLEVGKVFITIDDGSQTQAEAVPEEPVKEAPAQVEEEAAGVVGELVVGQGELPPSQEGFDDVKREVAKKKVLATPVVRKMAKDQKIDLSDVTGTGPGGRIMKEDLEKYTAKKPEEPVVAAVEKRVETDSQRREPLTRIRKTIVQKMEHSKNNLVHTTTIEEIDVSNLVAFRERMKSIVGDKVKLTYLPFMMKAIVLALKEFPIFNSSLDEEKEEIVYHLNYNIGIATDTDRGLVVPVLFDADRKSILEIAEDIKALAELARDSKLTLEHLRGGTFTITNYGAIGGTFGTPIINYPESAILGIGRIQEKPVVKNGEIVIGHLLPLSLSFDHRIIDGASGIRFMRFLEEALNDPELLLLRS